MFKRDFRFQIEERKDLGKEKRSGQRKKAVRILLILS